MRTNRPRAIRPWRTYSRIENRALVRSGRWSRVRQRSRFRVLKPCFGSGRTRSIIRRSCRLVNQRSCRRREALVNRTRCCRIFLSGHLASFPDEYRPWWSAARQTGTNGKAGRKGEELLGMEWISMSWSEQHIALRGHCNRQLRPGDPPDASDWWNEDSQKEGREDDVDEESRQLIPPRHRRCGQEATDRLHEHQPEQASDLSQTTVCDA